MRVWYAIECNARVEIIHGGNFLPVVVASSNTVFSGVRDYNTLSIVCNMGSADP